MKKFNKITNENSKAKANNLIIKTAATRGDIWAEPGAETGNWPAGLPSNRATWTKTQETRVKG